MARALFGDRRAGGFGAAEVLALVSVEQTYEGIDGHRFVFEVVVVR